MTYKTYMPKIHQIFCRYCKKQNKMGEIIINVFGEVHKECYDREVNLEFSQSLLDEIIIWCQEHGYSTTEMGAIKEFIRDQIEELEEGK